MTPEAQRIAIAEACGWLRMIRNGIEVYYDPEGGHVLPHDLPDYLNDLNAMYDAEKVLLNAGRAGDWRGWDSYRLTLDEINGPDDTFHATAAQRAEAFLRTIGKWEESS